VVMAAPLSSERSDVGLSGLAHSQVVSLDRGLHPSLVAELADSGQWGQTTHVDRRLGSLDSPIYYRV